MARLIGVFGGTFDPPHIGHLILADCAQFAFEPMMEKILWVLAGDPPHKHGNPITPADIRMEMVLAAIEGNRYFDVSRADIARPGPHYSVDMLEWLQQGEVDAGYVFLMGADSLRDLPAWHAPQRFLAACQALAVMRRPGVEIDLEALEDELPGIQPKVRFFDAPQVGISGSDIRRRVRAGEPYRYLVPGAVAEIIRKRGLYQ